jgi:hypothetical protein
MKRFPFTWILVLVWIVLRLCHINIEITGPFGLIFAVAGLVVIAVEFYKSSDIGLRTFKIEKASSWVATVAWAYAMGKFADSFSDIHIGDLIVGAVVFVDDWLSTTTSFAMALRNIVGNVGHSENPEGN